MSDFRESPSIPVDQLSLEVDSRITRYYSGYEKNRFDFLEMF